MVERYYEDVAVGDTWESPMGRTISEADVYTQAGLSGSYNPLHTDREYMADSEYEGRLVQNTLLISIMTGLNRRSPLSRELDLIAAYGWDDLRFVNPAFIGDTVRLETEVVDKQTKDDERGVVTIEERLFNQDDDLVAIGEYLILVARR